MSNVSRACTKKLMWSGVGGERMEKEMRRKMMRMDEKCNVIGFLLVVR